MSRIYAYKESSVQCPVEAISGVWRFERSADFKSRCKSTPGHLLHLILSGGYLLKANGREYPVKEGDVIYYHEEEEVESVGQGRGSVFYSVSFRAPALKPLPLDFRVFCSNALIRRNFKRLYELSLEANVFARSLGMHAALLEMLSAISHFSASVNSDDAWGELEASLRKRRMFRASLDELGDLSGMSRSSVVRACRVSTGKSPMERLRGIRLEEARALLRYSTMSVTQVAEYLGYPRIHEFSREFSKYFGFTPKGGRAAPPKA